jgi:hypothetical protein
MINICKKHKNILIRWETEEPTKCPLCLAYAKIGLMYEIWNPNIEERFQIEDLYRTTYVEGK